ncbi:MAG: hypothetical protein ACRYFX_17265 [Janthinobacterium lividum]
MVANHFAVLLAQAAMGVGIICGFLFAVLFGAVYSVLLLVNLLVEAVQRYKQQPLTPLISNQMRSISTLIVAFLGSVLAFWWIVSQMGEFM